MTRLSNYFLPLHLRPWFIWMVEKERWKVRRIEKKHGKPYEEIVKDQLRERWGIKND